MNINSMLNAVNSSDGLQQAIGIQLLSKTNDMQASGAAVLLQDFANSQVKVTAPAAPHLGANLDIRV